MQTKIIMTLQKKYLLSLIFLMSGCASTPAPAPPVEDKAMTILTMHANRVARGMEQMASAEGTMKISVKTPSMSVESPKKYVLDGPVAGKVSISESLSNGEMIAFDTPPLPSVGLNIPITLGKHGLPYTADLESAIERICALTGWTKGDSLGLPVSPILVTLPAGENEAFSVLTKLGAKLNRSADLIISESSKTITISYPVR